MCNPLVLPYRAHIALTFWQSRPTHLWACAKTSSSPKLAALLSPAQTAFVSLLCPLTLHTQHILPALCPLAIPRKLVRESLSKSRHTCRSADRLDLILDSRLIYDMYQIVHPRLCRMALCLHLARWFQRTIIHHRKAPHTNVHKTPNSISRTLHSMWSISTRPVSCILARRTSCLMVKLLNNHLNRSVSCIHILYPLFACV